MIIETITEFIRSYSEPVRFTQQGEYGSGEAWTEKVYPKVFLAKMAEDFVQWIADKHCSTCEIQGCDLCDDMDRIEGIKP